MTSNNFEIISTSQKKTLKVSFRHIFTIADIPNLYSNLAPDITCIDFSDNEFGIGFIEVLAEKLESNKTVTNLNFSKCKLRPNDVKVLTKFLKADKTITYIDLSNNNLNFQSAEKLADALAVNNTITHIILSGCRLELEAIKLLTQSLKANKAITHIDISCNNLDAKGVGVLETLAEALKITKTITHVNLSSNNLVADDLKTIAKVLKANPTPSITYIDLSNNNLLDPGSIEELEKALKINKIIDYIDLSRNSITKYSEQLIVRAVLYSAHNINIIGLSNSGTKLLELANKLKDTTADEWDNKISIFTDEYNKLSEDRMTPTTVRKLLNNSIREPSTTINSFSLIIKWISKTCGKY
jgi:Ran GTPase-activating protein (RanGAP) involved in mRNA processing and transport